MGCSGVAAGAWGMHALLGSKECMPCPPNEIKSSRVSLSCCLNLRLSVRLCAVSECAVCVSGACQGLLMALHLGECRTGGVVCWESGQ